MATTASNTTSRSHGVALSLLLFLVLVNQSSANAVPNLAVQFLAPHNKVRAAAGLPPLSWDQRMASYAESYANRRRVDCALVHSGGPYGENIFWGSGEGWTPAQAVQAWVEERRWYDYGANSCARGQKCGHYTQVVWGSTRKVGCAVAACGGGRGVFITCNYDPPGNYVGERPY